MKGFQEGRKIVFPMTPVAKPRMTRKDKWAKRPIVVAYFTYANALRALAQAEHFTLPDAGFSLRFDFPVSESWSEKKKAEMIGKPHQQSPDIDNCIKAVLDPLLKQDCTVWHIAGAEKRWAREGRITITEVQT